MLTFSYCKSLIAKSLSYMLGTASHHLLPRSLSVCPVADSTLHTYNTGHGPNNAAHLGASAGHQPPALPPPSPLVYITAHCKHTFSYLHPEPQLIGTFFVDRGRTKFTHNMGRTSRLSANPGLFEGELQARIALISSSSQFSQDPCYQYELNAFWCGDI